MIIMTNLWSENTPANFWKCLDNITDTEWETAVSRSLSTLDLDLPEHSLDTILEYVLGERRFGDHHWKLSQLKKLYYLIKPLLPRNIIRLMRKSYLSNVNQNEDIRFPIEDRFARFLWETVKNVMKIRKQDELPFIYFWPAKHPCAFVLTHDIETETGQKHVWNLMELEIQLGYKSSYNFIPERYPLDEKLMDTLKSNGFEIGIHGLKHDGRLFSSRKLFEKRAEKINDYLEKFGAVGFRSPLTHRQPEWMQILDIEYDLSFFDTDPFEPIPGGTMSIFPYQIGNFIELPYTLVQDYSLLELMGEKKPDMWLQKVDFLKQYHGLILINSHPDYLQDSTNWEVYKKFLLKMKDYENFWQPLPREAANWWQKRMTTRSITDLPGSVIGRIQLINDSIQIKAD